MKLGDIEPVCDVKDQDLNLNIVIILCMTSCLCLCVHARVHAIVCAE